jgi:hypothetical protein
MSDYDPNRMNPNRPDLNQARHEAARDFNWSWIIGGVAALVVLLVALSFVGRSDQTADTGRPAATTGQASPTPATPAPPERPAPRPAAPNQ